MFARPLRSRQSDSRQLTATPVQHARRQHGNLLWHRLATNTASDRPVVQAQLEIGNADDQYEQEADQVADQVMRMPEHSPIASAQNPSIPAVQRLCNDCEDKRQPSTRADPQQLPATTSSMIQGMRGGGKPLSNNARNFFEPRFGMDFHQVRVHTDSIAEKTAQAINAKAFTSGQDIVFNSGEFAPETDQGKRLLAHELTHVVQQGKARSMASRIQRQTSKPLVNETFLVKLPVDGIHLKVEPYDHAENFPGDKAANGDVVIVRNSGGAATYNNVKNGIWSWIEIPGKSSPDPNYPLLHGFIPNSKIAGLTIGPLENKAETPEPDTTKPEKPAIPEACPDKPVDDYRVIDFILDAEKFAKVSGGWDVEQAFRHLKSQRCIAKNCCDVDLAAAEHYMFSRYMVFVEGIPYPVWVSIITGYAGLKSIGVIPSVCPEDQDPCPVTPASTDQLTWATEGGLDGSMDSRIGSPPLAHKSF